MYAEDVETETEHCAQVESDIICILSININGYLQTKVLTKNS